MSRRPTGRDRRFPVRRVAAWTPLVEANLYDWYAPDSYVAATPLWADKGPLGHDLAKAFANSPVAGIPIDGKSTVDLETAAALKNTTTSLAAPWTAYAVLRAGNLDITRLVWDGHTSTNRSTFYRNGATTDMVANAGANLTASGAWRKDAVHAVRIQNNGDATSKIYVTDLTGTAKATGTMGTGTWAGITLGAANTGSSAWEGDYAEVIRFSGTHNAEAVAAYLLAKYPSIAKRDWTAVNVMCTGDSITVGVGSTDSRGYRSIIRRAFEADDIETGVRTLAFVGPTDDKCMDHFGVSGEIIEDIRDGIAAQVTARSPDLVVLLMGTNNCRNNGATYDATLTPAAYADTLANIAATDADLPVVVCLVPPLTNSTHNANVNDLNAELLATVIPGASSPITVCDLNSIITPATHLGDGVHPNDAGYALIADAIEAAIRSALA